MNKTYYPNIEREMKFQEAWAKINKLYNEEASLFWTITGESKFGFDESFLPKLKDLMRDVFSAPRFIPCFDPNDLSIKNDDLVAIMDSATGEIKVLTFSASQRMWRS